jgi:hypothetical protein
MNGEMFTLYTETRLVPTLRAGDVTILDNLSSHESPAAASVQTPPKQWITGRSINAAPGTRHAIFRASRRQFPVLKPSLWSKDSRVVCELGTNTWS